MDAELLNGRTTRYEDINRPARNGLEHVQMVLESHSPIDLLIIMLRVNDFQDVIGVTAKESAFGLQSLISKVQALNLEPMNKSVKIMAIIPPEIIKPLEGLANKFSGFKRGNGSESEYFSALDSFNVYTLKASKYISLSKIDGIHIDELEHSILGEEVAKKVIEISST